MSRILVISDTQAPFHHKQTIPFLEAVYDTYQLDTVVHVGDELDFYVVSRYPKKPGTLPNVLDELQRAKDKFLFPMYETFPVVDLLESNHGRRIARAANEAGLPEEFLKPYKELLEAPAGWNWHPSLKIDGVRYEHGDALGGSSKTITTRAPVVNRCSTVVGHFHANPSIMWHNGPEGEIFGMNVGCLMDRESIANAYYKGPTWSSCSTGVVLDGVPVLVKMEMSKSGKSWNGKVTT